METVSSQELSEYVLALDETEYVDIHKVSKDGWGSQWQTLYIDSIAADDYSYCVTATDVDTEERYLLRMTRTTAAAHWSPPVVEPLGSPSDPWKVESMEQ